MTTAYITHPSSLLHDMGPWHPERPQRISAINDHLLMRGMLDIMTPYTAPAATREQLGRVHDWGYLAELEAAVPLDGYHAVDPDTSMNSHSLVAAQHAAGAAILAAELVTSGEVENAFCNIRPPGHHATRHAAMGFCFYNNVAVGIAHALATCGVQRVALIDFDVHHGNGSEDIFAGDDRVLMVSTFQRGLYPFTGDDPSAPNMQNVGLEARSGSKGMREAVEHRWIPVLDAFKPELIFISAGFDAHRDDDMGRLGWVDDGYAWITRHIVQVANHHCGGRIVSMLEGGYELSALARSVCAHLRVMTGVE
jgi:acetoin utilization deacetylase AcuC-like enzyme